MADLCGSSGLDLGCRHIDREDELLPVAAHVAQVSTQWAGQLEQHFGRAVWNAGVVLTSAAITRRSFESKSSPRKKTSLPSLRQCRRAELNRLVEIPIVGGENNIGVHEFR